MKITIELDAMKFYAYHGILPQETRVGNYFIVNVSYAFFSAKACSTDDLNDTISYADVYNVIKTTMEHPSKLLEHLTARISKALKSAFPQISYLKIRVSKMNPPLGGEVQSASVTIQKEWQP